MLLIQKKIGHLSQFDVQQRQQDTLALHWYETNKRLMHKTSAGGQALTLHFLNESPAFAEGDVLHADNNSILSIAILPCPCLVVSPASSRELAALCYEIGNRHLAVFYTGQQLLVPMDVPLYRLLQAQGYIVKTENRKLMQPLKTTVLPHVEIDKNFIAQLNSNSNTSL